MLEGLADWREGVLGLGSAQGHPCYLLYQPVEGKGQVQVLVGLVDWREGVLGLGLAPVVLQLRLYHHQFALCLQGVFSAQGRSLASLCSLAQLAC